MNIHLPSLLLAISLVETGNRDSAVGARGERGRYQISSPVWFSHTRTPFSGAHNPETATRIASLHLAWITANLPPKKRASVKAVAIAWNAGLCCKKPGRSTIDYASRVEATYSRLPKIAPSSTIPKSAR